MGGKYSVQVYVPNGSENGFDGKSMLSSVIPNHVQGHASTLSLSGCLQQQPVNVDDVTLYSKFYDPEQGHASTLFLPGYPQQQSDNVDDVTLYFDSYEETITNAFQN
ncbi:12787_t:CDS:2, partial [Gigaspora rosea]